MVPAVEAPTHRYMESSPGCWAVYGEVLAREYSDPAFTGVHRHTVDAYAVQHPGKPSQQSIRSVGIHLVRLCLILERNFSDDAAARAMPVISSGKGDACHFQRQGRISLAYAPCINGADHGGRCLEDKQRSGARCSRS